ncbi:hypothetical protein CBR_g8288 [Chara braunii]|uniref:J domain-containing protein n=1 Tax=Chara braunii TaxID=69332 RepID=A0A388KLW6_CHABU|nr:hypothetical protein CBR_g8288 [Chara braunii]|eukprot:GBG70988.1 hypothetical protein CBR_g8288 [Chara braunii]
MERQKIATVFRHYVQRLREWWSFEAGVGHVKESYGAVWLAMSRVVTKIRPYLQPLIVFVARLCCYLGFFLLRCLLRGMSSLVRMGSSAVFVLLWCSLISLAALAGWGSFTIALVVAIVGAVFYGVAFASLVLGLFGMGILVLYGSPWPTLGVAFAGGLLFYSERCRGALFVTMVYSIYSVKGHGGWTAVSWCVGLAFLSSDVVIYIISLEDDDKEERKGNSAYVAGMSGMFPATFGHARSTDKASKASKAHMRGNWRNAWSQSVPGTTPTSAAFEVKTSFQQDAQAGGTGMSSEDWAGGGPSGTWRGNRMEQDTGDAGGGKYQRAYTAYEGCGGESPTVREEADCNDCRFGEQPRTGDGGYRGTEPAGVSGHETPAGGMGKRGVGGGAKREAADCDHPDSRVPEEYSPYSPFDETASVTSRCSQGTSTSGRSEAVEDGLPEAEVLRVLGCRDHYTIFGLPKCTVPDFSKLRQLYRKKAMLVHPDKNGGSEEAAEAFKRLQNAYEVLLDPGKKKEYDAQLIEQEIRDRITRQHNRQASPDFRPEPGFNEGLDEADGGYIPTEESKDVACLKCSKSHLWILKTDRTKSCARWCQDCREYHPAKDGDGWLEQSGQFIFFGMIKKVDRPRAYACCDGKIYDVTEWVECQRMQCPANTHKPMFHVSTTMPKQASSGRTGGRNGSSPGAGRSGPEGSSRNAGNRYSRAFRDSFPFQCTDPQTFQMSDEELYEWLSDMLDPGMFGDMGHAAATAFRGSSPSCSSTSQGSTGKNPRKRKGRRRR